MANRGRSSYHAIIMAALVCALACAVNCGGPDNKVHSLLADMRSMDDALESYYNDHGAYPPWAIGPESVNKQEIPSLALKWAYLGKDLRPYDEMRTNRHNSVGQFRDPFANPEMTFSYYSTDKFWIIWSPGPDRRYDINLRVLQELPLNPGNARDLLKKYEYDFLKGNYSAGDIFRYCQVSH